MASKLIAKPGAAAGLKPGVTEDQVSALIAGAPDSKASAPAVQVPGGARSEMDRDPRGGGRKKPISLTIDPAILAELDRKAVALGLSRAAAFALAVSRFIANEDREANR